VALNPRVAKEAVAPRAEVVVKAALAPRVAVALAPKVAKETVALRAEVVKEVAKVNVDLQVLPKPRRKRFLSERSPSRTTVDSVADKSGFKRHGGTQ
jgi:hypothetical protein